MSGELWRLSAVAAVTLLKKREISPRPDRGLGQAHR